MRVIDEKNWSWMLYKDDKSYYLSIICGTVAMYMIEIQLNDNEVDVFRKNGKPIIEELSEKIRFSPKSYSDRHIIDFSENENVKIAVKKWRSSNEQ